MISKAVFKLYKYGHYKSDISEYKGPGVYTIHQITKMWDEIGANWTKATSSADWTKEGGDFSSTVIDSFNYNGKLNNDWFSWDVTAAVAGMVKNAETNLGFLIRVPDKNPGVYNSSVNQEAYFHSSEAADASLTPRLIVIGSPGTKVEAGSKASRRLRIRCSRNAVSVYAPEQTVHSVAVTDYMGRTVFTRSLQGKADWVRIPCGFAAGLYYVTVQSEGMREAQRVIAY